MDSGSSFPDYFQVPATRIQEINEMVKNIQLLYGFKETSETVIGASLPDDASVLRGVKEINPNEIKDLIDMTLRDHLSRGVKQTMENFGHNIANLPPAHVTFQVRDTVRDVYQHYGEKLGLIDGNLPTLTEGKKYNLDLWDAEVHRLVVENFEKGLQAIVGDFRDRIRSGRVDREAVGPETWIKVYAELAREHGVSFDIETLRSQLVAEITGENIQQGVDDLLQSMKVSVREDGGFGARMLARHLVPKFLDYIKFQNLEDKVNSKELIDYMQKHGIVMGGKIYRLTGRDTSILRK